MKKQDNRPSFGFTLIELLVVIAIIGILAALVLSNFNSARDRARDAQRKSDTDQIKKALQMYYNDNSAYPTHDVANKIVACAAPDTATKDWGTEFSCGSMIYMKMLPHDPSWDSVTGLPEYQYVKVTPDEDYCLWTQLSNHADGDIAKSHARCESTCQATIGADYTYAYIVCAD